MYQVCSRIKKCRVALLKWSKGLQTNSSKQIMNLKNEMEAMSSLRGDRDWQKWTQLKGRLNEGYKSEESFWRQKSRIQWLKKGDRNLKFFHAYTIQRRKTNSIEKLIKLNRGECETEEEIEEEVTQYCSSPFTTSSPQGW